MGVWYLRLRDLARFLESFNHVGNQMALHPNFPTSPYEELLPDHRWFPADETLRSTAYEKLLPPLVANVRQGSTRVEK